MYFPAGMYHAVECLEDSISINISLTGVMHIDLILSTLKARLLGNSNLRRFYSKLDNKS